MLGRCAQRWAPTGSMACGQTFDKWRPNRRARPYYGQQGEYQGNENRDQLKPCNTLFEGRHVDFGVMVVAMPIRVRIVEVRPVKCTTLAISTHMQVQPAHLHGQQTKAHDGNE